MTSEVGIRSREENASEQEMEPPLAALHESDFCNKIGLVEIRRRLI